MCRASGEELTIDLCYFLGVDHPATSAHGPKRTRNVLYFSAMVHQALKVKKDVEHVCICVYNYA